MDKKSQHVGNHGGVYTDNDGQTKQFTYIDHDVKQSIRTTPPVSAKEIRKIKSDMDTYKENKISEILSMPAVSALKDCFQRFEELAERTVDRGIIWREDMVRDACRINDELCYGLYMCVWRNTVKESNWFHELRDDHEGILRGEWKDLM